MSIESIDATDLEEGIFLPYEEIDESFPKVTETVESTAGAIFRDQAEEVAGAPSLADKAIEHLKSAYVPTQEEEELLELTEKEEEKRGKPFSFEEIHILFSEYVRYMGEYKRSLNKSKQISKEAFRKAVDRLEASYKNKLELGAAVLTSALFAAGGMANLAMSSSPKVANVAKSLDSFSNVSKTGQDFISTKIGGYRQLKMTDLDHLRNNNETWNQEAAQPGRKQDEANQKLDQAESNRHRTASETTR